MTKKEIAKQKNMLSELKKHYIKDIVDLLKKTEDFGLIELIRTLLVKSDIEAGRKQQGI